MERADLLEQAQQGDPRAIAAILNQQLKYRALECHAIMTDRLLHLLLRGEDETPDRNQALDFVRAKLVNLDIDGLSRVRLYGLEADVDFDRFDDSDNLDETPIALPESPAWTHEFALAVGGYSHLIAAKANSTGSLGERASDAERDAGSAGSVSATASDRPMAPPQPLKRAKKQPTPLSLAIVAIALGLIAFSGYRVISRNSRSSPETPSESISPDSIPPEPTSPESDATPSSPGG